MSNRLLLAPYAARLRRSSVKHYLPPTFTRAAEAEGSVETCRTDELLHQVAGLKRATLLIVGGPGSGKTSFVTHSALRLLSEGIPCVIVNSQTLRRFSGNTSDPRKFLLNLRPAEIDEKLWKSWAKHGSIVFLIDAVNEIEREFQGRVEKQLARAILEGNHRSSVLATSRSEPEDWSLSSLRDLHTYAVAPLGESEVEEFIALRDADVGQVRDGIRASGMDGVASNPFLLALLSDWHSTQSVEPRFAPRSRAELLVMTMHGSFNPTLMKSTVTEGLSMSAVLCAAALSSMRSESFTRDDLVSLLSRVWPDGTPVHEAVEKFLSTQMIRPVDDVVSREPHYMLLHRLFVDFGLALAWATTTLPAIAWDPTHFEQCLGDWVGLQSDPDETVRGLIALGASAPRYDVLVDVLVANQGRLGRLTQGAVWRHLGRAFVSDRAARFDLANALTRLPPRLLREGIQRGLLREVDAASPELARKIKSAMTVGTFNGHLLQSLRQQDQRRRREEREDGTTRGDSSDIERHLATVLAPVDDTSRLTSIEWLLKRAPARAIPILMELLDKGDVAGVREAAATGLGQIRARESIASLSRVASDRSEGSSLRVAASRSLGALRDSIAAPALIRVVQDELSTDRVRSAAARALGLIGSETALPSLIVAISTGHGSAEVRRAAAFALGLIGETAAVDPLSRVVRHADVPTGVRSSAAYALGQIGDHSGIPALADVVRRGGMDEGVRCSAASALGVLGTPECVEVLIEVAGEQGSPDAVRAVAAHALGQVGSDAAVATLILVLQERVAADGTQGAAENVRGTAANALGLIGSALAVDVLAQVVSEPASDAATRGSAANALGLIGSVKGLPALVRLMQDDTADERVRGSAAHALGAVGSDDALTALIEIVRNATVPAGVRGSAAHSLGLLGSAEATSSLSGALLESDLEPRARVAAALALGRLLDPAGVPALIEALETDVEDQSIASASAWALGRSGAGSSLATAALARALVRSPGDARVRGAAALALGRIATTGAVEILETCALNGDESLQVRTAAVHGLEGAGYSADTRLRRAAGSLGYGRGGSEDRWIRKFRGAVLELTFAQEPQEDAISWLETIVRLDPDRINRTTAIRVLSKWRVLSSELIRFCIAPETPRPDGRPRDTDWGVCGTAAAAVLRMATYDEREGISLIPAVLSLLNAPETSTATINAALAPLQQLESLLAQRVLNTCERHLAGTGMQNVSLGSALGRASLGVSQRTSALADLKTFADMPERVLGNLVSTNESRSLVYDSQARCDVAIVTAIRVETVAVHSVAKDLGIALHTVQRRGRYFDAGSVAGESGNNSVVITQASDKGGQSAAAVTRDLITEFNPRMILLVGVCGGFPENGARLGDVIVARNVFNYDPERLQPQGGGSRPQVYRGDEQLTRLLAYLDGKGALESELLDGRLVFKDFASGEKVVAWKESGVRKALLEMSTDIYGVETEAHGVMHAIWETFKDEQYVSGAVVKVVSDLGDEDMSLDKDERQARAATTSARVAFTAIQNLRRG